jgi:hypothetical protein
MAREQVTITGQRIIFRSGQRVLDVPQNPWLNVAVTANAK